MQWHKHYHIRCWSLTNSCGFIMVWSSPPPFHPPSPLLVHCLLLHSTPTHCLPFTLPPPYYILTHCLLLHSLPLPASLTILVHCHLLHSPSLSLNYCHGLHWPSLSLTILADCLLLHSLPLTLLYAHTLSTPLLTTVTFRRLISMFLFFLCNLRKIQGMRLHTVINVPQI